MHHPNPRRQLLQFGSQQIRAKALVIHLARLEVHFFGKQVFHQPFRIKHLEEIYKDE